MKYLKIIKQVINLYIENYTTLLIEIEYLNKSVCVCDLMVR